jgi:hypothetical protein
MGKKEERKKRERHSSGTKAERKRREEGFQSEKSVAGA